MKKKILFTLLTLALFICLFTAIVGAEAQGYSSYEVTLTDGTTKTAYAAGVDPWEGRVFLNAKLYAEAPLYTDGMYEEIAWSSVKVLDFTNTMLYVYDINTDSWSEKAYGSNQGNTAMCTFVSDVNGLDKSQCTSLEKIITGKIVTLRGGTLGSFPALKELVISSGAKEIGYNAFEKNLLLEKVTYEGESNLTSIGYQAFKGCSKLTTVNLPNTVSSMGESIFDGCTSLKSVNWPTGMTTIPNSTFSGCKSLEFEIPSNITKIGFNAFRNCDSFVVVNVPASVATIDGFAFAECDNLTTVDFAENSMLSNKLVGIAFSCPKLTSFEIPSGVTTLGYDNFWHCTSLKEIDISGITEITGGNNFGDTAITKLVFSNELETLASGNINDKVEEIRFGANIVSIGSGAFNVKTLKRVYLSSTLETLGSNILGWSNPNDSSMNITFIFTGTKEEAEALQTYYREWTLANNPGHAPNSSKFYDAVLVSADEYDVTQEPSGYHLVYGYNKCEAFYDGEHTLSDKVDYNFEGDAYVSRYISTCVCTRDCGENVINEIAGPLFINKGYSVYEENSKGNITYGIYVDEANVEAYEKFTGNDVSFGFVVGNANDELDGKIIGNDGTCLLAGAIATDFATIDFKSFSVYNLKLTGIAGESQMAKSIYCSTYVVDGGSVSYIGNTVTDKAVAISYNSIFGISKDEE